MSGFDPSESRDENGQWTVGGLVEKYLLELNAVGFKDRDAFNRVFGELALDKSLKNADLIEIAKRYTPEITVREKTREGIMKHIHRYWAQINTVHAKRMFVNGRSAG